MGPIIIFLPDTWQYRTDRWQLNLIQLVHESTKNPVLERMKTPLEKSPASKFNSHRLCSAISPLIYSLIFPTRRRWRRRMAVLVTAPSRLRFRAGVSGSEFPPFLPKEVEKIKDPPARELAKRIQRFPVNVSTKDLKFLFWIVFIYFFWAILAVV